MISDGTARLLSPLAPEWTDALARASHDVYHLPEYVAFDATGCGGTATAFWYRDATGVFLVPLVLRRMPGSQRLDAMSPYGYPAPVSDVPPEDTGFWRRACQAMADTLRRHGVVTVFVRLHPLLDVPLGVLDDVGVVVHHGETVSVDLTLSVEEMWRRTRRDHRKDINRARRSDVTVVVDAWDRLPEWVVTYHDTMRRVGAADYYFFPEEHFAALRHALGGRMHLAVAEADGTVLGGTAFFEYRGIIQGYVQSARSHDSRHADKLLYDEVRRWGRARGDAVFHFGGGVGGANDSLFAYKAGFSDRRHPFYTWRVVTDPPAYERLLRHMDRTPDPALLTGRFPPYR